MVLFNFGFCLRCSICVCVILNINQSPFLDASSLSHSLCSECLAMLIKRFSMQGNFKGGSVRHDECIWGEMGQWGGLIKWKCGSHGNSQVSWRFYKWVLPVTLILSAFSLSLCVFRLLLLILFHHLSHALYKSYLILSAKGNDSLLSCPCFHFPFLSLCQASPDIPSSSSFAV